MSLKKRATRRLPLLAGSSLVAASLSAFALTGVVLTPGTAHAYDECVPADPPATLTDGAGGISDPTLNGATADSFACAVTPYPTGIAYSSDGALTVTKTNAGVTTVTANGVNLTGNGADAVTWNSSAGGVTGGAGTAGPVIDVTSVSGPISITTAAVTGNQAGTTNAIRATSTGAGAITVSTTGTVSNTAAGAQAAIAATTNGGNISVSSNSVSGRLRGILAQTSGAGSVTLNVGFVNASTIDGIAAIDATAGTGGLTINLTGTAAGGTGTAIIGVSTGGAVVNNTTGQVSGAVDFTGVTAGGVALNNTGTGRWSIRGASVLSAGADTVTMSGSGTNVMENGASVSLGAGNDTWNLSNLLGVRVAGPATTQIDFGAGADTFNMSGRLSVGGTMTLSNLEAFNNAGVILLGAYVPVGWATDDPLLSNINFAITDGFTDDVFVMNSGTFTGSGASRIVLDAYLDGSEQAGCETLTGAADCMDLRGASTAGVTLVTPNNLTSDAAHGGYTPRGITIVDVSGAGTSAAGHFILDPDTLGYVVDPLFGGVISRPGLFGFGIRYDPENQRHALVGLPRSEAMEYAMLSGAAQSIWHLTAETVTDRQTDLRERAAGGALWLRAAGEYTKRTSATAFDSFGETFSVDTGHKLYSGTIMGGMDLITGHSGGYDYVGGVHIGYVASSFDLNASDTSGRFSGATGGVYGGVWTERFFLDGTFNMNGLTLDYDSPGLGSKTNTYTTAFGARLDGGMRLPLSEVLFAEPLVSLAFARTSLEEISLSGGEIQPADAQSRRAALGLRVGGDVDGQTVNWSYYLTGRAWNEFDGEALGVVNNPGAGLPFVDEFSGGFGEAEAGLSLYNDANTLSGFVASGVKFKDGYSAIDLSLGLRMAW